MGPTPEAPSTLDSKQLLAFSFQPPAGGDVTLRSSDGTLFITHSLLLSLASKVFSDMFGSTTVADIVELAEDAEAISLMLAFIYPVIRPPINTIPLLEKAMLIAHKYEIEVLEETLKQSSGQQRDLIRKDPVRVLYLAKKYGFRETQTLAAKLVARCDYDMTTVDGLLKLAKEYPEWSHVIGVVGVQAVRSHILNSISVNDLRPRSDDEYHMACNACWGSGMDEWRRQPGWAKGWVSSLTHALAHKHLDDCDSYFELSHLETLRGSCCIKCIEKTLLKRVAFEEWARGARAVIERKLAPLDVLFQPPAGGDVSLKSSDGTIFTVHSMFLSFSSKVFSDMFSSSTKADVIELAEDAET
ncbi:hypothetical protein FRC06_006563, partial [Ceratobasidium sp. 370]